MTEKRILLTGVNGQVGFELALSLQGLGTVLTFDRAALTCRILTKFAMWCEVSRRR